MNKDAVKPNREQQQVIDTIDGPVLVVAGAGTGKTATIVKRIEHIISDGYARPWQVLAITFTNKAAGELDKYRRRRGKRYLGAHFSLNVRQNFAPLCRQTRIHTAFHNI